MRMQIPLLLLATGLAQAQAQPLRDPTAWPAALQQPAAASAASGAGGTASRLIIRSEGRAYVVTGGRRLGVGAQLGGAEIVRIEDNAVWLRDASGSRREPLYPGIDKRPAAPDTPPATPANMNKNKPARAASSTRPPETPR